MLTYIFKWHVFFFMFLFVLTSKTISLTTSIKRYAWDTVMQQESSILVVIVSMSSKLFAKLFTLGPAAFLPIKVGSKVQKHHSPIII